MKTENEMQRMKELIEVLNRAAKSYYTENTEIMTNAEYDRLYDELQALEKSTGVILTGSLSNRVGYEILDFLPKEAHTEPRLSLDKTKEVSALAEFLGEREGILMWKLDGLTLVLTYEDGRLVKALTRGNGEIGELVTKNVEVFRNVPLTIPYKGRLLVRGEAIIKYSDFHKMNLSLAEEEKYKNPRNLCSGSVRQLNTEITAKRNVHFIAYELLEGGEKEFKKRHETLSYLQEQGFSVVEFFKVTKEDVGEFVKLYSDKVMENDEPSDGLVLQLDDISYGKSLGKTSKFPRHSIAFKWKDETAETVLREIEWSASRTGLINPVAIFDPVELEGTTVTRASLHNISIMKGLKLGLGDKILVYKANMIIPQVLSNLTESDNIEVIKNCPVCYEKTEIKDEAGVQTLLCKNPNCMAKRIKLLTHFVSRNAMNIAGLSEMTLEKFVAEGMLHELADIFSLKNHKETIVKMEGFGEKSYQNLMNAIEKARDTNAVRVLYSLGIPNIGLSGAKLICRQFRFDIDKIRQATAEELMAIDGIGELMAEAYVSFFQNEKNKEALDLLLKELRIPKEAGEEDEEEKSLEGLNFVITGEVSLFKNRKELSEFIEKKGGKVTGSVTGKTNYLINNDILSSSGKNKKAKELGVNIINEASLMELIGGRHAD